MVKLARIIIVSTTLLLVTDAVLARDVRRGALPRSEVIVTQDRNLAHTRWRGDNFNVRRNGTVVYYGYPYYNPYNYNYSPYDNSPYSQPYTTPTVVNANPNSPAVYSAYNPYYQTPPMLHEHYMGINHDALVEPAFTNPGVPRANWVRTSYGTVPSNARIVQYNSDGKTPVYSCAVENQGQLIYGLTTANNGCYVSDGNNTVEVNHEYHVLTS